jgi:hypothetical protein
VSSTWLHALKAAGGAADPARMAEEKKPTQDRRSAVRLTRRTSCELDVDGKVHSAVIRDVTPQGLFVVTRREIDPGTRLVLRIRRPGGEIWEILASTARQSDGRRGLISDRGIGLVIDEAPIGFHEFCASLVR